MSTHGEHMARWIASVPAGRCPACEGPLPKTRRRRVVCDKARCARAYRATYLLDAQPTTLQRIVRAERVPEQPDHRRLYLACGCTVVVMRCRAGAKAKRCAAGHLR